MTINPATARTAIGIDGIDALRDWIVVTVVSRGVDDIIGQGDAGCRAGRAQITPRGGSQSQPASGATGGHLILAGSAGELDQVLVELEPDAVVAVDAW